MKRLFIIIFGILLLSGCGQSPEEDQYNWSTMDEGPYQDKIGYARSSDLLHWTDSDQTLAEHASVPGAMIKDGVVYVYFVDVSVEGQAEQLALIKSSDQGQTWSAKEIIQIEGLGEKVAVDPTPFLLSDGRTRLYYFDINEANQVKNELTTVRPTNKIYSAISEDGVDFTEEEGIRLAEEEIYDPEVIYAAGRYLLYVGDVNGNKILVAESSDGLNFGQPQLAYSKGAVPDAFYDGTTYYLYTAGIEIATSSDGLTYEPTNYFFQSNLGEITADPAVVQLGENDYLMVYKYKVEPLPRKALNN